MMNLLQSRDASCHDSSSSDDDHDYVDQERSLGHSWSSSSDGDNWDSDLPSSHAELGMRGAATWRRLAIAASGLNTDHAPYEQWCPDRWHEQVIKPGIVHGARLVLGFSFVYILYMDVLFVIGVSIRCIDSDLGVGVLQVARHSSWERMDQPLVWLTNAVSVVVLSICVFRPWKCLYMVGVVVYLASWGWLTLFYHPVERQSCYSSFVCKHCSLPTEEQWNEACVAMGAHGFAVLVDAMTWMWILPHILPDREWTRRMAVVWMLVYFVASYQESRGAPREDRIEIESDMMAGALFLSAVAWIALRRKRQMLLSQRLKFRLDRDQEEAVQQLHTLLTYMVPPAMISPLLKNKTMLSTKVQRASVMFVKLVGFDQLARSLPPSQILEKLNELFTDFDTVCQEKEVTKIETWKEEYVCAVGVLQHDIDLDRQLGHKVILERLVLVASDMLKTQMIVLGAPVEIKIGVHTGPVIAGIVGEKLPRFRLFGDTVNIAARMMQQGLPGCMQFGETTRNELPRWARAAASCRGQVEMRGKGLLTTYLIDQGVDLEDASMQHQPMTRSAFSGRVGPSLSELILSSDRPQASHAATFQSAFQSDFDDVAKDIQASTAMWQQPQSGEPTGCCWRICGCYCRGWPTFLPDAEEEFQEWFLERQTFKSIDDRLGNHTLGLVVITAVELVYFFFGAEDEVGNEREIFDNLRGYMICRCLCCVQMVALRYALRFRRSWSMEARSIQRIFYLCVCVNAVLLFISYDSIDFGQKWTMKMQHEMGIPARGVSSNLGFLFFFFLYMLAITAYSFSFWLTTGFVLLATLLIMVYFRLDIMGHALPLGTSTCGCRVILWSCLVAIEALIKEALLRDQYKSSYMVELIQQRIEGTLDALMPPLVVKELRPGSLGTISHFYSAVTLAQSDLVGFTRLASTREAAEVVAFISDLFGRFDQLADEHRVRKVETVGDAYIAGQGGLPLTEVHSPTAVVHFALGLVQATAGLARKRGEDVSCRVGVHSSNCVGGIVGHDRQRYHLFGELMTCLEVLEVTSQVGRVHVSASCKKAVDEEGGVPAWYPAIRFEKRGEGSLVTSKGEVHDPADAGGLPTFFAWAAPPDSDSARARDHHQHLQKR